MRKDTEVVLGIRSVGDKAHEPIIESMTMIDALKRIASFTVESTMSQRFQFVLTRSREDALIGLGLSATLKDAKRKETANNIAGFIEELFESDAPAGGLTADKQALKQHTQGLPRFLESNK